VSWFYQNQIKSEEEFQAKKAILREEAKKRLEQIMAAKKKLIEFDSDLDDFSIASSELSELDSDVDSLSSMISCANSWIEDVQYKTPAENTLKYTASAAMIAAAHCVYQSFNGITTCRKVLGVVLNSTWPTGTFFAAIAMAVFAGLALLAAVRRSKRFLLASLVGCVAVYGACAALVAAMYFEPTKVDSRLKESACARYSSMDTGSRLCQMLPTIERELDEVMAATLWGSGVMALCCLTTLGIGVWYIFELAYVEKKAMKHKRRHKRRKHTIPWHKIKIVGPVLNCGGGGGGAAAGKAPHAGAASGGKCPFSAGAAATTGPAKKDKHV